MNVKRNTNFFFWYKRAQRWVMPRKKRNDKPLLDKYLAANGLARIDIIGVSPFFPRSFSSSTSRLLLTPRKLGWLLPFSLRGTTCLRLAGRPSCPQTQMCQIYLSSPWRFWTLLRRPLWWICISLFFLVYLFVLFYFSFFIFHFISFIFSFYFILVSIKLLINLSVLLNLLIIQINTYEPKKFIVIYWLLSYKFHYSFILFSSISFICKNRFKVFAVHTIWQETLNWKHFLVCLT